MGVEAVFFEFRKLDEVQTCRLPNFSEAAKAIKIDDFEHTFSGARNVRLSVLELSNASVAKVHDFVFTPIHLG